MFDMEKHLTLLQRLTLHWDFIKSGISHNVE